MKWKKMIIVGHKAYGDMTADNTSLMVVQAAEKDWFSSFQKSGEETVYLPFSYESAEDAINGIVKRVAT